MIYNAGRHSAHQPPAEYERERRVKTINEKLEYQRGSSAWKWVLFIVVLAAVAFAAWKFVLRLAIPALPVINFFAAEPTSITVGNSSALSWSVSGASEVTIDQGVGNVALTGTRAVSPTATATYTLTASNTAGNVRATAQVTVAEPPLPVISTFAANPVSISAGDSSTLSWRVSGATQVTIDQEIGNVALPGTRIASPTSSSIYTLMVSNAAGNTTATVQVVVSETEWPVIHSFTANPTFIFPGGSSMLSWNVSNADTVTIDQGIGNVDPAGSRTVSPTTTTNYTLTASNGKGSITTAVSVTIIEIHIIPPIEPPFEPPLEPPLFL